MRTMEVALWKSFNEKHSMQLIQFNCSLLTTNILLLNDVLQFLALSIDSRNVTQAFMLNTALQP